MNAMRVLVFGASGDQGAAQVRRLRLHGHRAVAVTRNPQYRGDGLRAPVAGTGETVYADYRQPQSLSRAIAETRPQAIFLNLPSTSFQAAAPLLQAAEEIARASARTPGVQSLVFNTSMIVHDQPLGFAAHDARLEMRRRIMAAAPAVSIQPVIYLDNLLRAWALPTLLGEGVIRYPHAEELEVCWIAQDDVADLMIAAMTRPDLAGRSITVGGPEAVRGPDLARRLGAAIGRALRFESEPVTEFAARMGRLFEAGASLESRRLSAQLARIYQWYNSAPSRPFYVDMKPVLEVLPVALTSVEQWARRQTWP